MAVPSQLVDTDPICPVCHQQAQAVFATVGGANFIVRHGHVHVVMIPHVESPFRTEQHPNTQYYYVHHYAHLKV